MQEAISVQNPVRQVKILSGPVTDEEKRALEANVDVAVWLGKVGYSTRPGYVRSLSYFLACVGIQSPSELLDLKCQEDTKHRLFPAEQLVEAWIGLARQNRMSPAGVKKTVDAVRSFFKHNRVPLVQVRCGYKPRLKQALNDDEIRRFRGGFNWYGSILFDFLLSVPLRDGQFQKCPNCGQEFFPRWRDIQGYPKIEAYSAFAIRPQKGHENENYKQGLMQVCFLTGSAAKALNLYRQHKEAALARPLQPDEYIFTHQKSHRGPRHIAPVSKENIVFFFQEAQKRTGVHLSPHFLRTYANSVLASRRIDKQIRDIYLGHSCAYEMGYVMQMIPKWRQDFKEVKAMEHLDLAGSVLTAYEVDERLTQIEEQRQELARLRKDVFGRDVTEGDAQTMLMLLEKFKQGKVKIEP